MARPGSGRPGESAGRGAGRRGMGRRVAIRALYGVPESYRERRTNLMHEDEKWPGEFEAAAREAMLLRQRNLGRGWHAQRWSDPQAPLRQIQGQQFDRSHRDGIEQRSAYLAQRAAYHPEEDSSSGLDLAPLMDEYARSLGVSRRSTAFHPEHW